jgi:hypothetical protein
MVNAVLVVETLHATSLPPHLFVLFVLFVVPARTLPSESGEVMENGQWGMDNGEWTMDNGQWRRLSYQVRIITSTKDEPR